MIVEYHRPKSLEEALALLARPGVETLPLGGGSALNRPSPHPFAVVDLQELGLDRIRDRSRLLEIGATATLQAMLDTPGLAPALYQAIRREAAQNLRHVATTAGTLVAADGRSPFTTALLAMDASLAVRPGRQGSAEERIGLGDLLADRPKTLRGRLIVQISIPLNARLAWHAVARTPADRPIVCAAAAAWPSGRTRLALGGYGLAPAMVFDGPEPGGAELAARDAYSRAGDEWASAEYRQEMAGLLARRCLEDLAQKRESE